MPKSNVSFSPSICGGKTYAGTECQLPKGFRTRHKGKGRCYHHELSDPIFPFSHPSKKIKKGDRQCRSPIELESFKKLDLTAKVAEYEPEPFKIDYTFQGKNEKYIPDILVTYRDGRKYLLEIKSRFEVEQEKNKAKYAAALKYSQEHGMEFRLWVYDNADSLNRKVWLPERIEQIIDK